MNTEATITPANARTYQDWMSLARRMDKRARFTAAIKPDVSAQCRRACRLYIDKALALKSQPCVLAWVNYGPIGAALR